MNKEKITSLFTAKANRSGLKQVLADSLTVMFADTRTGHMNEKTQEAFNRMSARAEGDANVARYVAKIELSLGKHMPHVLGGAPPKM